MSIFSTIQTIAKPVTSKIGAGVNFVSGIRNTADDLINTYILGVKGARGIEGFVFDAALEDTVQLTAEITDHYIEDNSFINDHVAIKPIRIQLRGLIGELVYNTNQSGVLGLLQTTQNLINVLPAYLGDNTPKGLQDVQKILIKSTSVVNKIDNYISRAQNIVGLLSGSATKTKQQQAYSDLKELFMNRTICSVETPYEIFSKSMIIESITFKQLEESKYESEIVVSLKELRVSSVYVSPVNSLTTTGRALMQRQEPIDTGKLKGAPTTFGSKLSLGYRLNRKSPQ